MLPAMTKAFWIQQLYSDVFLLRQAPEQHAVVRNSKLYRKQACCDHLGMSKEIGGKQSLHMIMLRARSIMSAVTSILSVFFVLMV